MHDDSSVASANAAATRFSHLFAIAILLDDEHIERVNCDFEIHGLNAGEAYRLAKKIANVCDGRVAMMSYDGEDWFAVTNALGTRVAVVFICES